MSLKRFDRQSGIGLLEIMLAIAVTAIIIMTSMRYYQSAQRNELVNQGTSIIKYVMQAANDYALTEHADMTNFNAAAAIGTGDIPGGYISGNTISSPWGTGSAVILSKGSQTSQYQVKFTAIPDYACNDLSSNFAKLTVNPSAGHCSGSGDNVTLTLIFGIE